MVSFSAWFFIFFGLYCGGLLVFFEIPERLASIFLLSHLGPCFPASPSSSLPLPESEVWTRSGKGCHPGVSASLQARGGIPDLSSNYSYFLSAILLSLMAVSNCFLSNPLSSLLSYLGLWDSQSRLLILSLILLCEQGELKSCGGVSSPGGRII